MEAWYLDFSEAAPTNLAAESCILGAVLVDEIPGKTLAEARAGLTAEDFSLASHRKIFERICELADVGSAVTYVTLADLLQRKGELAEVGGAAYLVGLTEGIPRYCGIKDYIAIVKEKSLLRQVMRICESGYKLAATQGIEAREVANGIYKELKGTFKK